MAFFACPRRAVTIRVTKPRLTAVAAAKRVPRPAGRRPTFRTHDQPLKRRPPRGAGLVAQTAPGHRWPSARGHGRRSPAIGPGVGRAGRGPAGAARARRHPDRLHPVRAHAAVRGGVPPSHAARRRHRSRRDHGLQARVLAVRDGAGGRGARHAPWARMGAARQPVRPAAGLRAAVEALRGKSGAGVAAAMAARRLERRVCPAGDDLRAVVVPRQHRGGADRRHDRQRRFPPQGAHRVPRRDRRGVECGRVPASSGTRRRR